MDLNTGALLLVEGHLFGADCMFDYSKVEHYRYSTSHRSHEIKWGLRRVDNGERVVADDCLLLTGHARHFYIDLYDTGIIGESLLDQFDFDSAIAPYLERYWEEDFGCANRNGFIEEADCYFYDKETSEYSLDQFSCYLSLWFDELT